MATQMIDDITKMAIRPAIKMMEEIYTIIKDKLWVDWENDSNRFLVSEKSVHLLSYLTLTGLSKQIDVLNDFNLLLLMEDGYFKLYLMQLEFPAVINALQTLCRE